MTYIPSVTKDFATFTEVATPAHLVENKPVAAPRRGFWGAIFNAIWTARQRQADAEIARYLAMTGGKLTDSAEREISRRLSGENFRLR